MGHEGQTSSPIPEEVIDLPSLPNPCGERGGVEFHGRKGAGGSNGKPCRPSCWASKEKCDFLTYEGGKWEEAGGWQHVGGGSFWHLARVERAGRSLLGISRLINQKLLLTLTFKIYP